MNDCSVSPTDRFHVSLANEQSSHTVDECRLADAARAVLEDSAYESAIVSIAVIDDAKMQQLNRQYLNHDWPTDVLSFSLEDDGRHLEGEIIISADTAASAAAEVGSSAAAEQLLYVIHGALHLVGYNDKSTDEANQMRLAEARYWQRFGSLPHPLGEGRGEGEESHAIFPSPCPLPKGEAFLQ
jgi:probable rRNA maturation factor